MHGHIHVNNRSSHTKVFTTGGHFFTAHPLAMRMLICITFFKFLLKWNINNNLFTQHDARTKDAWTEYAQTKYAQTKYTRTNISD